MRRFTRPVQVYIIAVIAGGGLALLVSLPQHVDDSDLALFATLAVSGVLAGMHPLPLMRSHVRINLTGGILLVAVFLTSVPTACLLAAVVAVLSGVFLRRRLWNILFMAGVLVLSVGFAAALYRAAAEPSSLPLDSWRNILALCLSGSAYWLTNSALVIFLASARNGQPFLRSYLSNWREIYLHCVLLTLLAVLGAAAWHQGAVYAFLLFVPAVTIYQWFSATQLKQEQVIRAIETIAEVLDRRNAFTYQHSHRVAQHAVKMAKRLGLSELDIDDLRKAALIHDIGKLGVDIPAEELPPNRRDLTDYQFYSLKQHAQLGAMIAREIPAFEAAEEPIRYHHDWYNGRHVSRDHAGQEIPLGARIIAIADSYDRLCMANGDVTMVYDPMAIEQLRAMAGTQLDPEILSCFLEIMEAERSAVLSSEPQSAAQPARQAAG